MRPEAGELHHFAFHHVLRQVDQDVQNLEIALLQRHLERLHVQPIAGQHAAMISPARIGRRPAPARVGAVDHVVMNQRGAVDQLDDGAQAHRARPLVSRVSRSKQQQRRTQALPAAAEQVARRFRPTGSLAVPVCCASSCSTHDQVVANQIENLFYCQQ